MKARVVAAMLVLAVAVSQTAHSDVPGEPPPHAGPPPITMPDEPVNVFLPTQAVGYVDATSRVTSTGQYSYTVPIEVPAGRAGMTPELSLKYLSRRGNGLLGVGWSLEGMSQIATCPATIATEGYVDGVDFDDDRFCLDGEKLIAVNGGYGGWGTEYRTERNTFAKIVSYGFFPGPISFTVWTKDGREMRYRGISVDRVEQDDDSFSLVPAGNAMPIFVLDQVLDRYGNAIKYSYFKLANPTAPYGLELYPRFIEYAFTSGGEATRKVELVYDDRPDPYFEYQNGVRFETTQRLVEVRTWAPHSQTVPTLEKVLSYRLEYEELAACNSFPCPTPPSSWRSRLTSVAKCDAAAEPQCTWARQFVWQHHAPTFAVSPAPPADHDGESQSMVVLDLDGDGKDDILYRTRYQGVPLIHARFGGADGLGAPVLVDIAGGGLNTLHLVLPASRPLDLDGDGSSELYATFREPAQQPEEFQLRYAVLHWNPAQAKLVVTGPVTSGPTSKDVVDTVRIADLDGDGRPDVLRRAGAPDEMKWVYQENSAGQLSGDIATSLAADCFERTRVVDLDGDGRGQVLGYFFDADDTDCTASRGFGIDDNYQFSESTLWRLDELPEKPITGTQYNTRPGIVVVDANGDGLKDVVFPAGASPTPKVAWNSGNGFGPNVPLGAGPEDETFLFGYVDGNHHYRYYGDPGNRVVDINGDGIEDIISFRGETSLVFGTVPRIEIHLGGRTASGEWGFTTAVLPQVGGLRHSTDEPNAQTGAGWTTSQIGDFNGDGLVNIVQLTAELYDPNHFEVLLQEPAVGDVITEVWDELANRPRERILHSPEWRGPGATSPTDCAYPQVCSDKGLPVVRERQVSQGEAVGAFRRTEYDYSDPRVDLQGRGFLGFGMMRERDPDLPREVITTFDHRTRVGTIYPYAGLPEKVTTITPILEQPTDFPGQPPPPSQVTARVTEVYTEYAMKSPPTAPIYFVHPSRWTILEWEEEVEIGSDQILLLEYPNAPVIRRRTGSSSFDDYGNRLTSMLTTEGGVRRTVSSTYTNDAAKWLIGLRETLDVSASDEAQVAPPAPRHTEFDYHPTTGALQQTRIEPLQANVWRTTTYYTNTSGLVYQTSDQVANEPVRWTYLAYDADGVFVTQRYNDLLLYDVAWTNPGFGAPTLVQAADGIQTTYQYDGLGRLRGVTPVQAGEGRTIDYSGDDRIDAGHPRGVVVSMTEDGGGGTKVFHDELGRAWESATKRFQGIEAPLPTAWIHEGVRFNVFGATMRQFRPGLGAWSSDATIFFTDTLGRRTRVIAPNGAEATFDQHFFSTTILEHDDPAEPDMPSRERTITQDRDGRVTKVAEMWGGSNLQTKYDYGFFDQVDNIESPDVLFTFFDYDAAGRREYLDDPNRGLTHYAYNGFGELSTVVEPDNETISYARDVLGRVNHWYDNEGAHDIEWDQGSFAKGKVSHTHSPHNIDSKYYYNSDGLLSTTYWTVNGDTYQFDRSYDDLGRLQLLEYPEIPDRPRFTVEQRYDAAGYLADAADKNTGEYFYRISSRTVDLRLGSRTLGADMASSREYYDDTGWLKSLEAKSGSDQYLLKYEYYRDGNVKSRRDLSGDKERVETLTYDELDRVQTWSLDYAGDVTKTAYSYDTGGNIESVQVGNAPPVSNSFDPFRKHLLTADPAGSYDYDDRGRQEAAPQRTVTYTSFDLPRTVTLPSGTTLLDYDAFGTRVRKSSGPNSETVSLEGLFEKRTAQGPGGLSVEYVFYVHSEDGPVAQVVWDTKASPQQRTLFIESDELRSIGFVSDTSTGKVTRQYYDPFGKRIAEDGSPDAEPADMKLGFTGQRHDGELGLIDMKGRVYDAAQRRFLTPDPVVADPFTSQHYNRYAYALNNPLRYTDPTGFDAEDANPEGDPLVVTGSAPPSPPPNNPATDKLKKVTPNVVGGEDPGAPPPDPGAGTPSPDQAPREAIGGSMQPPEIEPPTRDPGRSPEQTLLRSIGEGLVNLLPNLPVHATAGDVAWFGFGLTPVFAPIRTVMGGAGIIHDYATAITAPDMHDAAKAAGSATAKMIGLLAGAVIGRAIAARVPNPGGSRGGPAHRATIERRIGALKEQGHEHLGGGALPEEVVRTPGGTKTFRRPDITTRAPDGTTYRENVGRSTQSGGAISREVKALDDIERATGARPGYTPYDK